MPIGPVGNDRNADDSPLGVKPKGRKPLARDGTLWILTPCLFTQRLTRQFEKALAMLIGLREVRLTVDA